MNFQKLELLNDVLPQTIESFFTPEFTNYIIVKDGHIIAKKLEPSFDNLVISSLEEEVKNPLYKKHEEVFTYEDDAFQYNIEETNSGLLIHVPRNQLFDETLHVFYIQEQPELVNNTFIVLEDNSSLKYFEYFGNMNEGHFNFVSNSIVGENARLEYTALSKLNEKIAASMIRNSYVSRYGNSNYNVAEVNDSLTDAKITIYLNEKYAVGTAKTVAITSNEQEARFKQLIEHNAPDTEGYIENYGVSNNQSILVFEGIGSIKKNMKRAVARQSNKGIVLGAKSRLDANPLLLIDEFDVVASHGAAIGKMDEEQLYYLMSRGLTLKNAERLIISGFLSPVLKQLTTDQLKEDFVLAVETKTL